MGTEITEDTTFTYTYAEKQFISRTVTFKVKNGAWNDGTTADKTVTLSGYDDKELNLTASQIPAVGNKPDADYKAGHWDVVPDTDAHITGDTTYTYSYAHKDSVTRTVTFKVANGAWDDTTTDDEIITLVGNEGDTLRLKDHQIPTVGTLPDEGFEAGSWDTVPSTETPITADTTYTYTYKRIPTPTLYFAAHVQNDGWGKENKTLKPGQSVNVGTTGRGLRVEALAIMAPEDYTVDGFAHVQNVGDMAITKVESSTAYTIPEGYVAYEFGTTGKSQRVEAVCVGIKDGGGEYVKGFQYATHLQNYGWQGYVRNGSFAGTRGMALRMESLRFAYTDDDVVKAGAPKK